MIPSEQIAGLLVVVTGCGIAITLTRAFAHRLRGGSAPKLETRVVEELEDMREQIGRLQGQLDEVLERQDFAERVLAQAKERGQLGAGR